jgi:hypothetical protein
MFFSFLLQQLRYSVSFEVLSVGGKRSAEEGSCPLSRWGAWPLAGKTAKSNKEVYRQASWMIFMGIPIRGANSKGTQSSPICPCNNEVFVLKVKPVFELPYVHTFYPFVCMGPSIS